MGQAMPLRVVTTIADFRGARAAARPAGPLGFVPTMGYLHEGHIALVRRARAENATVAASIFVNPAQFAPHEDFAAYPRNLDRDMAMLEEAGCDLLFHPSPEEMYPPPEQDVYVTPNDIASRLEGAVRPGHFQGVATVVLKLFNIVQPDRSYFGQKDGQQVAVIRRMAHDLNVPGEIIIVPTVREPDGLAMSSRNTYLSAEERTAAAIVFQALSAALDLYSSGEIHADALRSAMRATLQSEPRVESIDYVSIADLMTLIELEQDVPDGAMASTAVRIGRTRLIDNVILTRADSPEGA